MPMEGHADLAMTDFRRARRRVDAEYSGTAYGCEDGKQQRAPWEKFSGTVLEPGLRN